MSKGSFSKKISESMFWKMGAITNFNFDVIYEKDEYFELALCLAYMALSKEKIIAKDKKNTDRLARITRQVDASEIDKVFQSGFAEEMPIIYKSRETDNTWILDSIRDSIMHGAFDIDEDNKCFLINNTQHERELMARIPFSWFIAYAKNDILSQKQANNYTIRGFYYNNKKKDNEYSVVINELYKSILYRINIYGDKFNIRDIEENIRKIIESCSKKEIDDSTIDKYKDRIESENKKYDLKYMASFYNACDEVENYIKENYPGLKVNIYIDDRKHKNITKISKKLQRFYLNYDLMHDDINRVLGSKGMTFLKYLSNIIESINARKNGQLEQSDDSNKMIETMIKEFNSVLKQKESKYVDSDTLLTVGNQNRNIMFNLLLNVYGLATIVINQEELYNDYFLEEKPFIYGFRAKSKKAYKNYAEKRRKLIIELLDIEMSLYEKQDQFIKCPDDIIKEKIKKNIDALNDRKAKALAELEKYPESAYIYNNAEITQKDYRNKRNLDNQLKELFNHFTKAKTEADRYKIKKLIKEKMLLQIELESKFTYVYCDSMEEVLSIIRNSFSHIGRVSVGKYRGGNTSVILNDYSDDDMVGKTGDFIYNIAELMLLLNEPYKFSKEEKEYTKK